MKAVVVRGTKVLQAAHPDKIQELAPWMAKGINAGEQAEWAHTYGTGAHIEEMLPTGSLPIRNFRDGEFPNAAEISANTMMGSLCASETGRPSSRPSRRSPTARAGSAPCWPRGRCGPLGPSAAARGALPCR